MKLRTTGICFLAVMSLTGMSLAQSIDECHAERYKSCSAFRTSRAIEEHAPVIDKHLAGFTRSKGSWKVTVGYGPPENAGMAVLQGLADSLEASSRMILGDSPVPAGRRSEAPVSRPNAGSTRSWKHKPERESDGNVRRREILRAHAARRAARVGQRWLSRTRD